jgi:segregation and condensation protein B
MRTSRRLLHRPTDRLPANHRWPYWQRVARPAEPRSVDPAARDEPLARVEAVLFAAEEPISLRRLGTLAEVRGGETRRLVERLRDLLTEEGAAFRVEEIAGGFQLLTRPEFHPWLVRLRQTAGEPKLSGALLETLAIIAYRQPIMRAELEAVRGVHCADALRQLMERGFVRIAGRHDSLGRPVLYGTTKKFLTTFGLRDLRDLPPVAE